MDLIITILPVVTKDLPISPRFTPYDFLLRCKFSTLTTRQPMVEFYLLTFPRFPLRKKEHKFYFGKNRTHDFRTSRCAGYLTVGKPRKWGDFTDSKQPLQTNSSACLSVQFLKGEKPTARMKVPCHIVPPMVLQHGLLLGRDSFLKFQNHTYATLPKEAERPVEGVLTLS